MADIVAPTEEQLKEVIKEAPKLSLDSHLPLQQQAGKISKFMESNPGEENQKKENEEKTSEKVTDKKSSDETEESKKEEVIPEEDDDEDDLRPEQKTVELGTVEKYILDKLPTLTVRVKEGDNIKVLQFKDTADLPADFEIATDSDRAKFTSDVAMQTQRARDALNEYKQAELQENVRKFEAQEAEDVAADIAYLQKRGIIPPFQYAEDDPKFNSDEAVKTANEIYDLYKKTNQQYAERYANTSRTYRISYRDAADKYFARLARSKSNESQTAKEQPVEKKTPKATEERQQIARKQGAPQGGEPSGNKPRVRSGMKLSDINRLVSQGRI